MKIFRLMNCRLLFVAAIVLLSGCGFQLRGNVDLPEGVEPIYIGGIDRHSQLALELQNLLTSSGIQLTNQVSDANYQLKILNSTSNKRSTALGEGALIVEYQLIETVNFELLSKNGQRVLGPHKITERRIMPNDPNKVVSSNEEEKILRREMLQNLAAKVVRQLQSFNFDGLTKADNN
ncbi:MAG: LPS assembly lipoprotein LptE [Oceanicoccus sp.]